MFGSSVDDLLREGGRSGRREDALVEERLNSGNGEEKEEAGDTVEDRRSVA